MSLSQLSSSPLMSHFMRLIMIDVNARLSSSHCDRLFLKPPTPDSVAVKVMVVVITAVIHPPSIRPKTSRFCSQQCHYHRRSRTPRVDQRSPLTARGRGLRTVSHVLGRRPRIHACTSGWFVDLLGQKTFNEPFCFTAHELQDTDNTDGCHTGHK